MVKDNTYKYFFGIPPPPGYNSERIVLESADVIHSVNCHKIGCKCTPLKDCNKNDEQREMHYKQVHKGKYAGVRALKAKKREEKLQQQADLLPLPKQDEPNLMEDFEPL